SILPLSGADFLKFLDNVSVFSEPADKYIYHVRHILQKMTASNLLVDMRSNDGNVFMPKSYYALSEITSKQAPGLMWLSSALGGRFVHCQVSPAVVHIVGEKEGNAVSGSGIIFDENYILTCRHVVDEMEVNCVQNFQNKKIDISENEIFKHETSDVALIHVNEPLCVVGGLAFFSPTIAQTVYAFGYPKIPNTRPKFLDTDNSYLIMQSGEITNESVIASDNTELFLFSAISRPGNSGGPIVSEDGYVVGIATDLTDGRYHGEHLFAPHYAGISSAQIAKAVFEMGIDTEVPYETFD
ncbi:MAG: trypsin-like peptidase domain-containing protein, partial [Rhodospirillaceae bacterium]|nr:trypsin-like peptidase domain-containing protein [Rhodospirillaceae bacterium]